ncbi:hypothetical protein HY486_00885 [Candidatus Woesearchaeota archaeon]|nr:hypothetical protein [Candidatus Woesearchaeota archaeon]
MNPQYLVIVNNEQTSDGSGFFVVAGDQKKLEETVQEILSERIKEGLEEELRYQERQPDEVDYRKVPDFIKSHLTKSREGKQFSLEAEGDQYQAEFGLSIKTGAGFLYGVEVYDVSGLPAELAAKLASLAPNTFIYLHEMDTDLELELKERLDVVF